MLFKTTGTLMKISKNKTFKRLLFQVVGKRPKKITKVLGSTEQNLQFQRVGVIK
jgi:hypothetical protein